MNCLVTAGPTYEPLDEVRRLTNFSTGRLGTELANFLVRRGHNVTLLIGNQATYRGDSHAQRVETFGTTTELGELMRKMAVGDIEAVFHAAAVSDYTFGKVWLRDAGAQLTEVKGRKLSTRKGTLLAELLPTPKVIAELRALYPRAKIVGWKYEADGDRSGVLRLAESQMTACLTDACVANGPAYGEGFGIVTSKGALSHHPDAPSLYEALEKMLSV